jgi:hypothetical protein
VQFAAPDIKVPFDALRPNDGAAVGQVHVVFEIPAEILVVGVLKEGLERDFDTEPGAGGIGELDAISIRVRGGEEDAKVFHDVQLGWYSQAYRKDLACPVSDARTPVRRLVL